VDDDRFHARGLQERDVARESLGELRIAHGVAAVFHHDDLAVVGEHVGQRRRDQARALDRVDGLPIWGVVHVVASLGRGPLI
jgi:hypothetical protein